MSTIEIIVPPDYCPACAFTKRVLDRCGITYRITPVETLSSDELQDLRREHKSFPVLRTPVGTYSGVLTLAAARTLADEIGRAETAA